MENYIVAILGAVIVGLAVIQKTNKKPEQAKYSYRAKKHIMTSAEARFYEKMNEKLPAGQYIVPQAHLSMFIDHKIRGQNWRGAFARINGKSVDFLVVENGTNRPVVAIELDDKSHEREDRIARDLFVEAALKGAGIPLKRYTWDGGHWEVRPDDPRP